MSSPPTIFYAASPRPGRSGRLADRRHVEVGHADRRHRGPLEEIAPLSRQRGRGGAHLGEPAEQVDRRLVEPEVVYRAADLPVLDEIDAVARQAGEQECLRVYLADVPEAGEQQSPLGGLDHLRQRGTGPVLTAFEDEVAGERLRRGAAL